MNAPRVWTTLQANRADRLARARAALDGKRVAPARTEELLHQVPERGSYGDDVTHILSGEGIAKLLLRRSGAKREQAIRGVGATPAVVGPRLDLAVETRLAGCA